MIMMLVLEIGAIVPADVNMKM
jgi:hypothetical protein